ncbi:LEAF RUST 10 DISEASE-RESISTANCE LOCUS RECEPTOR-LIKE PROTEIN KINASE-like 1.2 isoform X4 [Macadamia integrifolia]|uniref:LEAF RUST 10 DISEASE-RESISTANCE LOCUS RECEPTOR-LIKE PROTEIN KINASE-like 1.2 isoform X4 n=1 Tax=Macadamia integrifolia TaxID=60698 RepID=UPI001C4FB600|nr:LEAF RUST 10 DISEASE-RESISTANCE LOCUS RECEPTOR-LIKE PROTEIN KINASE-like 1.2 isoform X4 [Macadamia integrifolia]
MDEQNQFMSCKASSLTWSVDISILAFSLVFLLLLSVQTTLCADWRYEACSKNISCGEGPNISYPFWIYGQQESYCGFPGFQLTCKNQQPILNLSTSDEYFIRNISYQNQSIRVIDAKVRAEGGCSSQVQNLTLDRTPFRYGPNHADLFLFRYCNHSLIPSEYSVHEINCSSVLSVALLDDDQLLNKMKSSKNCFPPVIVPVLRNSTSGSISNGGFADVNGKSSYYTELLKEGFDLIWKASECTTCQSSGGRCGFNWTTYDFACLCSDRPHKVKCGKKRNLVLTLTIAFGSLGVGMILACVMFFICYRRRHHKGSLFNPVKGNNLSPSSTPLSRNIASNSSCKDPEKCSTYFGVHVFTYDELEEATNNFNSERELGDGGFGTVYHGKLRDGREVAVKRLYENNFKRVEQFMNEVDILTRIRHQSLVTLYGCTSRHSRELLLVYEFIPNGTVADHLHGDRKTETGKLSWPIRMSIAIETATALSYLHASDIIHRDVKTNNILLDNNFRVKVADFGLSRLFPTDVTHVSTAPQGTPGYVDPEYHQCYQLTDKSDVYSFGVVLIELISSMPAVDINRHRHEINLSNLAINKIKNQALHELVDPCLGYETECVVKRMITSVAELAFCCLQLEKEMRPSMDEVLKSLKQIEREDYTMEKAEGVVIQTDTIGLLKNTDPPFSPDSVTNKWVSRSTTPNASA